MKTWKLVGALGCSGIWIVLAVANVDALTALGSDRVYASYGGITLTTKTALAILAVVIDLLLIASIFAIAHWWRQKRRAASLAALVVWSICSAISWHSTWVWIGTNIARSQAPATQSADLRRTLREDIDLAQKKLSWLMSVDASRLGRRDREKHKKDLTEAEYRVDFLREQLREAKVIVSAHPITGFEAIAATAMLALNALGWLAIFGSGHPGMTPRATGSMTPVTPPGPVSSVHAATALVPPGVNMVTPPPLPPELLREINAVTAVTAGTVTPEMPPVAQTTQPPGDSGMVNPGDSGPLPPKPPGAKAVAPPRDTGKVVAINDAAVPAVRRWLRARTEPDASGHLLTSDAWTSYCSSGGPEMSEDDFRKALRDVIGRNKATRTKAGRGYKGLVLKSKVTAATAG